MQAVQRTNMTTSLTYETTLHQRLDLPDRKIYQARRTRTLCKGTYKRVSNLSIYVG